MRALLSTAAALVVAACAAHDTAGEGADAKVQAQVAEQLGKTFHHFTFDDIRPSELPGVYEVYSGPRIIYFAPAQNLMIFGELYGTNGQSLTANKLAALQIRRAAQIDHASGLVVGDQGKEVLAFVDPDCGYCKRAHEWLAQQSLQGKIREVVFFMPFKDRPDALARAENLVCAPAELRRAALDELWSKASDRTAALLKCDSAAAQLAAQAREAVKFGVVGTPTFVVDGQVVPGFDRNRLQALLDSPSTLPAAIAAKSE